MNPEPETVNANPCPENERLAGFIEGWLDEANRSEIETHLAGAGNRNPFSYREPHASLPG